ncbi:MBL fold metallo-hydrolase [Kribbella jiaozuonensis]|uniref:MBL fold metallo-hydrolase n=1 Tax=Kribbella jiaozuonensis TaxID=2575441 RepID=A0A4U3LVH2_9ACTN|nr:MBL fold metallo-hydrolase [Kribbella jiaozuonensis]TKK80158.1 MBL fold metallo-hydrolase [Kribbella jiaozuonensis]
MLRQVADGVLVHQSELLQNNTVVVQGDSGVLLIDPGLTRAEMACLAKDLDGEPVVAGFATHPDWDHALWYADLGSAPRYGTERCAAELRELRSTPGWETSIVEWMPPEIVDDVPLDLLGLITALPAGATRLDWDGPQVRVIEHRAHAAGHAALLIEERGVLVAGDMLSDLFIPMLDIGGEADPIEEYFTALQLFDDVADGVEVVVPGHGSAGGADELRTRIDQDRAYVEALRDGREVVDPRIGPSAKTGWEWVSDLHAGQLLRLAQRS